MKLTLDAAVVLQEYLAELKQQVAESDRHIERMAKRLLLEELLNHNPAHLVDAPSIEDLQVEVAVRRNTLERLAEVEEIIRDLRRPETASAAYQMASDIEHLVE